MYRLFAAMLATATLCVLVPTVRADEPKPGAAKIEAAKTDAGKDEALFNELDKNHDGKLTADEVTAEHRRLFERLLRTSDANKDGALDKDEFLSGMKERPEPRERRRVAEEGPPPGDRPFPRPGEILFRLFDTDHDGVLSEAEIQAAPEALKKLDKNGDGKITRDEIGPPPGEGGPPPREFARRGPDGQGPDGQGVGPRGPERRGPGGPGAGEDGKGPRERIAERIKAMDKNGDGKISKDEAQGPLKEHFEQIDANGDGFIDATELMQARERFRADHPGLPGARRPGSESDPKSATE